MRDGTTSKVRVAGKRLIGLTPVRVLAVLGGGAVLGLALAGLSILGFDALAEAAGPAQGLAAPWSAVGDAAPVLEDALVIGGLALGFLLAAALVFRRGLLTFLTLSARFRWSLFAAGFAAFALLQLAALGWTVGLQSDQGPFATQATAAEAVVFCLAALAFYAPSVLAEEILFRSWILARDTGVSRRNVAAVVLSGLAFCAAHLQSDPWLMLLHLTSGLAYAWAAVRLGGVEFAVGAHLAKNTVLAAVLGLPGQHRWGDEFPLTVALNIAAAIGLAVVVELVRRRRPPSALALPAGSAGAAGPFRSKALGTKAP